MRENLYDSLGRLIGYTQNVGQETQIFDVLGRFCGKHTSMTNEVFDGLGRRIGKGIELLVTLIKK